MKAREGEFIETRSGVFFDVKGLVHPPKRVIAFIRYFPEMNGERKKNGNSYGKIYSLSERYELLQRKYPDYVVYDRVFDETLCEVPNGDIRKHYDPVERMMMLRNRKDLDSLEEMALQLAEKLREKSRVSPRAIGISGSVLIGLQIAGSDLDLVIYGSGNCQKTRSTLNELLNDPKSPFKPYSMNELRALFRFRSKDNIASFEDFVRTESRKAFQGKFMDTDYFIRFVKDWNEIDEKYGDIEYKNIGSAQIKATIIDDSESIFTPCKYKVAKVAVVRGYRSRKINEIASFRGRFCDQARNGETVFAQGKVEQVTDMRSNRTHFRLLVGNNPTDYVVLA